MEKSYKKKIGVVLTDTFKLRRKKQFDLFTEFMRKYKMDLDEIYNIYTCDHLSDLDKDLKKLDVVWVCNLDVLPWRKNDKWDILLGLEENYNENRFVIYNYQIDDVIQPITKYQLSNIKSKK